MSFGSSSSHTSSTQTTNPWAPTVPYLENYLSELGPMQASAAPTSGQISDYQTLLTNAAAGNPFTGDITNLTNDTFQAPSYAPQIEGGVAQAQANLAPTAAGASLDFSKNPYVQQMIGTIGQDTANRINEEFAGAGRDIPNGGGAGVQAEARGLAQGEAPVLSSLYTTEQGNQLAAAQALAGITVGGGTAAESADQAALAARAGALPLSQAAIAASNYAPNTDLNLEQQLQTLPFSDLSTYASLLLPLAGLGGTSYGSGTTTGGTWGLNFGGGSGGAALGSLIGLMAM